MRPIKLVISAFGPYKDKVEIDFEKLGNNGVFLITGDTGSGKTTIFDAISFALFGVVSGSRRENSSLRSDFAKDDVKSYVELDFYHKGIRYKIERTPRYKRKKIRGSGETLVGGDAVLSYLNEVITGDKNVSDKCIEILGINANQFKQIVMIAQGEFMELLHSKSSDRAVIFRKIFDTGIYKNISDSLKEKYLSKRREYEDVLVSLNSYKNSIIWDRDIDNDISIVKLLELLDKYNSDIKLEEKSISLEKEKLDSEYQIVVKEINEGRLVNDSIDSLNKLKCELKELDNNKNYFDEKEIIVNKNKVLYEKVVPKRDELIKLKNIIKDKKKNYDNKLNLKEEVICRYNKVLKKYESLSSLEDNLIKLNNQKIIYDNKLVIWNEFRELEDKLDEKMNIFKLVELEEKKNILAKFNELNDLNKKLEFEEVKFKGISKKYREYNEKHVKAYEDFLNEQAGIIASNLVDGCPCPVCGSLEHPSKASIRVSVLSKNDLDSLKEEVDNFSKEMEDLVVVINGIRKDIDIYNGEVGGYDYNELVEELANISVNKKYDLDKYNKDELDREIVSLSSLIEDKKKVVRDIDNVDVLKSLIDKVSNELVKVNDEIREINNSYTNICVEKEKYDVLLINLENDLVDLEKEYSLLSKEYTLSYKEIGYNNEDEYLFFLIDKKKLDEYDKEINSYKLNIVEISSKIKSLEDFLKEKSYVNLDEFERKKNLLEDEIKEKNVSLKEINNKLFNNINVYNKISDVYDKSMKLEQSVMVYKDLSDTANGNISGKNKLEFEQYVQASYFDMVLVSANKRFNYMTDERFLLVRKEESLRVSDKLGLELEVIDNYTGKRRDIKSLSGGESFKAALSLSLGMSDVIQEFAGGIVVDAMFIDEGFGSLDDNSLEQALNAIMMLGQGEKIIGIISHVNELKNRIDKKIVVKKTSSGSNVEVVV